MNIQTKTLRAETYLKTYCYDIYVHIRDIIIKYDSLFNQSLNNVKQSLKELKDILYHKLNDFLVNLDVSYKNIIKMGFQEYGYSRLSSTIEQIIKTANDNHFLNNYSDENYICDIDETVKRFMDEKNEIMDNMYSIDKCIGNIVLE